MTQKGIYNTIVLYVSSGIWCNGNTVALQAIVRGSNPRISTNIAATAAMENGGIIGAGNLADNAHTEDILKLKQGQLLRMSGRAVEVQTKIFVYRQTYGPWGITLTYHIRYVSPRGSGYLSQILTSPPWSMGMMHLSHGCEAGSSPAGGT